MVIELVVNGEWLVVVVADVVVVVVVVVGSRSTRSLWRWMKEDEEVEGGTGFMCKADGAVVSGHSTTELGS